VNWFCKENEKHELLTDKLANIIGYGSPNQTTGFCFDMDHQTKLQAFVLTWM
jgi:hypothetical protein